jgi:hypothetical protein
MFDVLGRGGGWFEEGVQQSRCRMQWREGGIITHGFELIGVLFSSRVSLKRRTYWARGASQGEGGLTT